MPKVVILKTSASLSKESKEEIEKRVEEKTGMKALIIDGQFEIEIIGRDE